MLVCIDPGHGGQDPGAIGPTGLKEAEITLLLVHLTKERLEKARIRTCLTRHDDQTVSLRQRAATANYHKADCFVSIHCNAANNPEASGTEVFHFPGSIQGQKLAMCIYEALTQAIKRKGRGVKDANFAVLRGTKMPACLVEVAFISNPEEELLLDHEEFLEQAADGIATGILNYLKGVKP